jgi:hypothetical protein
MCNPGQYLGAKQPNAGQSCSGGLYDTDPMTSTCLKCPPVGSCPREGKSAGLFLPPDDGGLWLTLSGGECTLSGDFVPPPPLCVSRHFSGEVTCLRLNPDTRRLSTLQIVEKEMLRCFKESRTGIRGGFQIRLPNVVTAQISSVLTRLARSVCCARSQSRAKKAK